MDLKWPKNATGINEENHWNKLVCSHETIFDVVVAFVDVVVVIIVVTAGGGASYSNPPDEISNHLSIQWKLNWNIGSSCNTHTHPHTQNKQSNDEIKLSFGGI